VQNFTDQGIYLPKNVVNRKQFGLYNSLMFVDYEQHGFFLRFAARASQYIYVSN